VYCELRLNVPRWAERSGPQRLRQPLAAPAVLNGTWRLDFMHEARFITADASGHSTCATRVTSKDWPCGATTRRC